MKVEKEIMEKEISIMLKIIRFLLKSKRKFEISYEEDEGEKYEKEDFKELYSPSIILDVKSENIDKYDITKMLESNGFLLVGGTDKIDVYEKQLYERVGKKKKVAIKLIAEVSYDDEDVYQIIIFVKKLVWRIKS